MIGQLRGTIWKVRPPSVVIGAFGVGYEVDLPLSAFVHLPLGAEDIILHTHQVVREDGASLFGFMEESERDLFRQLLKINGVGPRLALVLLSSLVPSELIHCVESDDAARLTKVPGIGRKTADRLVLELRGKLGAFVGPNGSATVRATVAPASATPRSEAESALLSLGYAARDAQKMLDKVADADTLPTAELIRRALREVAR